MSKKKITFYCDIKDSFMHEHIQSFTKNFSKKKYLIKYFKTTRKIHKSEISFFLSCKKILSHNDLSKSKLNIVAHPGKLPNDRGSGVVSWNIIKGKKNIYVTLFEPNNIIDNGKIIFQKYFSLKGHELNNEIRQKQGQLTFDLVKRVIINYPRLKKKSQKKGGKILRKRTAADSKLDVNKTINNQFNLLRACDNERYPAFFIKNKVKYFLKIYKN
jgi:methionyl-tRNA formyltransferase